MTIVTKPRRRDDAGPPSVRLRVPHRGVGAVYPEHARDRAGSEYHVVRGLAGESDYGPLERPEERHRNRLRGRAGWNRSSPAPRVDQAGDALHSALRNPFEPPPNRMILVAELQPKGHRDARDVPPAEHCVPASQGHQLTDRISLPLGRVADLAPPVVVDPVDHRKREILFVLELVIKGAARVARLARHLLELQVAVAVAG